MIFGLFKTMYFFILHFEVRNLGFNNPFFVVGNVIFGDLPEDFPGTPTPDTSVPEPSLIHGLLALAVGAIVTRCGKKK